MLKFQKYITIMQGVAYHTEIKEELSNSGGPREAHVVTPVTIIFNHEFFNQVIYCVI